MRTKCQMSAVLMLALLCTAAATVNQVSAQGDVGGRQVIEYELVDEWIRQPWQQQAGYFIAVDDVTSTPDGTRYVFDRLSSVVHRLAPDGTTWDLFAVPSTADDGTGVARGLHPLALDGGPDGDVAVLGILDRDATQDEAPSLYVVMRLEPDGAWAVSHRLAMPRPWSYRDIALGRGQAVYLSRGGPASGPQGSIDIVQPLRDGGGMTRITPAELGHPGQLDVHDDGTIFVVSSESDRAPGVISTPRPGPTPTPRPSRFAPAHDDPRIADPDPNTAATRRTQMQSGRGVVGLLVVDAAGHTIDSWSTWFYDVAVADGAAYALRTDGVYDVASRQVVYDWSTQYYGASPTRIDVAPSGLVSLGHDAVEYRGLLELDSDSPEPRRTRYRGLTDQPLLAGPAWPRRLTVNVTDDEVIVLDGQVRQPDYARGKYYEQLHPSVGAESTVLHRWRRDGVLWAQNGARRQAVDVTVLDGGTISIWADAVTMRPDPSLPVWQRRFQPSPSEGDPRFAAVDAGEGHIAVLDIGRERVLYLAEDGSLRREWSTWRVQPNALPSDIAIHGDQVFLTDRGRNRIMVRDASGDDLGEWSTHDGPLRVETGPQGDVFVLGRGGWLLRYSSGGTLVSRWRLPRRLIDGQWREVTPGDLDVDDEGRVYASWWVQGPKISGMGTILDGQAGIYVFEPVVRPAPEGRRPLAPGACAVAPDKTAAPGSVSLGDAVDVTLTLHGECPGTFRPSQIMIVFDRSRSVAWRGALQRAKDAVVSLLESLDGEMVEVGLVSFADGAALEVPLTDRLGQVRSRIVSLDAGGDTRMAAGIDLARTELLGARRDPDAEMHIWVVSDGVFKDQPTEEVELATADGIILDALVFRTHEYDAGVRESLIALFDIPHLHEDLRPENELSSVRRLTAYDPQLGLFEEVTVTDLIPPNMRLVEGSIEPPPEAADAATIRWRFSNVSAAVPLTMTFRLEPLEIGEHPTNVEAEARWVDAWQHDGSLLFPVPRVEVVEAPPSIYLPFVSRHHCHRRMPMDIVLAVDTSGSMGRPVDDQAETALEVAREGMRTLVNVLDLPRDRVAVVEFNASARVISGLTGDPGQVLAGIGELRHSSGSRLDQGLALAAQVLDELSAPPRRRTILLLSDGEQYDRPKLARAWGDTLRARGISVYTIGYGPTADDELLRWLATTPDRYHRSRGARDLLPVYERIGAELACPGG